MVTATLVCAVVCGVAVVATGDAATVPPKCWAYHQPPCYYDVRIETTYTNGEFVLGTFRGTVSARTTATFRRAPMHTVWRQGAPAVNLGSGKLVSGKWDWDATFIRETLQATVTADIQREIPGAPPCRIRGAYRRPAVLSVIGNVGLRGANRRYRSFSLSYALTRRLAAGGTSGCSNVALGLHNVVSGHRAAGDMVAVSESISVGNGAGNAAAHTDIPALAWSYEHTITNPRLATPPWGRLASGRSFGVTHSYTGSGEPTRSSGSFGTSASARVRITFTRVR